MKKRIHNSLSLIKNCKHHVAFFAILLFTIATTEVSASHSAGGYLSYKWLYGTTYRFTVTFYKDCAGATPAPTRMEIFVNSSCGSGSVLADRIANTGQEIGYPCPNATTCTGGTNPGYRKFVYEVDAVFNTPCSDWKISFRPDPLENQTLGRNNAITTLVPSCYNPTYGYVQCNLYTEAIVDNVNHPSNSTVTFKNDPVLFVCAGQPTVVNMGANDIDGDSLVYDLVSAKAIDINGVISNVVYVSPLSGSNPLFPVGSVTLNPNSGDLSINTSVAQVGVIAMRVREYKNGVFMGSTVIEVQVVVQNCSANTNPSLSGINGTSLFADTICPGGTVNFIVNSSDPDAGQVVTMTWNNGIPSASFNSSGGSRPDGTFSWTTSTADARPQPYTFTVTVTDNSCPSNGVQTRAYSIYVVDLPVTINPSSASICDGQAVSLNASGADAYSWGPATGLSATTGATVSAAPSTTTTYTVTGTGQGCSATSTVVVTVTPLAAIAGPDTAACAGNFIQLHAGGGANYSWSPATNLSNPTIADPVAYAITPITYTVTISTGNCIGTATVSLNVYPDVPVPTITQSLDTLYCSFDQSYVSYQWYFDNKIIPNATGPFHKATQSGNYNVAVTDANGCMTSVGINIVLNVGLKNYANNGILSISPNPVNSQFIIHSIEFNGEVLSIYNVLGEIVAAPITLHKSAGDSTINVSEISAGIYFITIAGEDKQWIGKFVKE